MKLREVAKVVRSKNAGPFHITFDVMFADEPDFQAFMRSGGITAAWIAETYGVPPETVAVIPYPPAHALKVTIPRLASCGSPEDRDVYGAQQHGPLLELDIGAARPAGDPTSTN